VEHSENLKALREQYGALIWTPLPLRITWAEAGMQRRPVFSYAPESAAAQEAWQIVNNVMQVVQS
jgi:cellulose biosynthesis protein BcsQ